MREKKILIIIIFNILVYSLFSLNISVLKTDPFSTKYDKLSEFSTSLNYQVLFEDLFSFPRHSDIDTSFIFIDYMYDFNYKIKKITDHSKVSYIFILKKKFHEDIVNAEFSYLNKTKNCLIVVFDMQNTKNINKNCEYIVNTIIENFKNRRDISTMVAQISNDIQHNKYKSVKIDFVTNIPLNDPFKK